jgi:hypothetical protein
MYVLARNFDDVARSKLVAQVQAIIDSDEYQKQINARMLLSTTKNVSSQYPNQSLDSTLDRYLHSHNKYTRVFYA